MNRQARPVPFAHKRLNSVIRDLTIAPTTQWPKHLRLARNILTDDLKLDEARAQAVLIASYGAAHTCAREINQRSRHVTDFVARLKIVKIFARIGKCARRSPASLRHTLNRDIDSAVDDVVIDTESIEALIQVLVATFAKFPGEASSSTVLRALSPPSSFPEHTNSDKGIHIRRRFAEASDLLQQNYSALRPKDQRAVETALMALRGSNAEFNAAIPTPLDIRHLFDTWIRPRAKRLI